MKDKRFNSYMSMAAVFAVCSTMLSCSTVGGDKEKEKKPSDSTTSQAIFTADKENEKSYKAISWSIPDDISYVIEMKQSAAGGAFINAYREDTTYVLYHANDDFSEFTKINLPERDYRKDQIYMSPSDDGSLHVFVASKSYTGLPDPDYDDPNTDWLEYEEATVFSYKVEKYGADGELIDSIDISGMEDLPTTEKYINGFEATKDGEFFVATQNLIVKIGADGKYLDKIDLGNSYILKCGYDSNSDFLCIADSDVGTRCYVIDTELMKIKSSENLGPVTSNVESMSPGKFGYLVFVQKNDGIYGLKEYEDSSAKLYKLVDFMNTGLGSEYINAILALEDEDFVIAGHNYKTEKAIPLSYHITLRDEEEVKNTQVLTLATPGGYMDEQMKMVEDFNREFNGQYRIEINTDYVTEGKEGVGEAFSKALIAGDVPDLVYMFDFSAMQNLAAKGALADLYPFIENDPELSKDMFMPNVLKAGEYEGELPLMPSKYMVSTIAVKTKFTCGAGQNWTPDEMMNAVNSMPEDMTISKFTDSAEQFMWDFIFHSSGSFVDYANRTCSFDSAGFVSLLELAKNCPKVDRALDGDMTEAEHQVYYSEKENAFKNDKAFMQGMWVGDYSSYQKEKERVFGDDDVTFVGYPSDNGKGSFLKCESPFAILENSENKDAAWAFIRRFYLDNYQKTVGKGDGTGLTYLSVLKKNNEYTDKEFEKLVYAPDRAGSYDYDIFDICLDEANYYFAGEHTAQQAADMIQNRVSILVSEQSW